MAALLRFGGLGAASFVVNLTVTATLTEGVGAPPELSFAVALIVVFVGNFLACRWFVFPSRASWRRQAVLFLLGSLVFRGAEYLGFLALHTAVGLPYLPVAAGVLVASFLLKFLFYGKLVFGPAPENNDGA